MTRKIQVPGIDHDVAREVSLDGQREALLARYRKQRETAMLYVATVARDAGDCRRLLDMLGLLGESSDYLTECPDPGHSMRCVR